MSPKFTLLLSLLCLTVTSLSAQAPCFTKAANYSGRTDLFDPAPVNAVSCELVGVVDSLGANQGFRVVGVDLYPLAHFQNSDDGFQYAYDGHLQSIDAQPGGYLAYFVTYGANSTYDVKVELRLPEGGEFSEYSVLDKDAIVGGIRSHLAERVLTSSAVTTVRQSIQYTIDVFLGREVPQDNFENAGFQIVNTVGAVPPALVVGTSQATDQSLLSYGVHDFSRVQLNGNAFGATAALAAAEETAGLPNTFITSNINAGAVGDIDEVADLFESSSTKLSVWIHLDFQEDGSYQVLGRFATNYTEAEAAANINSLYEEQMGDYFADSNGTGARVGGNNGRSTQERCPSPQYCDFRSLASQALFGDGVTFGKNTSCYCCFVEGEPSEIDPNVQVATENYFIGITYGLIDGVLGTASFLKTISEGYDKVQADIMFSIPWFKDLYKRGKETGSWLQVTGKKIGDSVRLAKDVLVFMYEVVSSIGTIAHAIKQSLRRFLLDLSPHTGFLRTGYSVGIVLFEILVEILTGGLALGASIGDNLARLSDDVVRPIFTSSAGGNVVEKFSGFVTRVTDGLWSRNRDGSALADNQLALRANFVSKLGNCFAAGTLVMVASTSIAAASQPIETVQLFDLVQSKPTYVQGLSKELDERTDYGLISLEQLVADQDQTTIQSEKWYKATFYGQEELTILSIARPASWYDSLYVQSTGDLAWIELPEQGVSAAMVLGSKQEISSEEHSLLSLSGSVQPVTALIQHQAPLVLKLITENSDSIIVTPEHPFYSLSRDDWIPAGQLLPHEVIETSDSLARVASIATYSTKQTTVYNLEVRRNHNYYVGKSGLLVHNSYTRRGTEELHTRIKNGTIIPETPHDFALQSLTRPQLNQFFDDLGIAVGTQVDNRIKLVGAWEVAFSDAVVRRNPTYLQRISDAINPATHNYNSQALKQAYDNAPDKARFVELLNPGFQVPFGGNRILVTDPNIIQQSSSMITQIRNANNIGGSRNIGFLEGQINGQTINPLEAGNFRVSNDGLNNTPLFEPSFVARHVRNVDSEFKLLDDLAKSLGATSPANVYPQITGNIRLVSERAFCASCSRVITEFSNMFPNVNLSLINGVQ